LSMMRERRLEQPMYTSSTGLGAGVHAAAACSAARALVAVVLWAPRGGSPGGTRGQQRQGGAAS
jgi:hypothetical protein